ncbi:MAG: 4-alpha-glucanotransferase [Anaerovoracaceae bacterium]
MKKSGILMPVFSLPSKYGRGRFSDEALSFIDKLSAAGQSFWQILPLDPAGRAMSPYMSPSCFAGDTAYLDPEALFEKGMLTRAELDECALFHDPRHFEYILRRAYGKNRTAFEKNADSDYLSENASWLDDHALFMAVSGVTGTMRWSGWPDDIRSRTPAGLKKWRSGLAEEIEYFKIMQGEFFSEWKKVLAHAHEKNIRIIGDMPFYPGRDSVDLWAHIDLFKAHSDGRLDTVSGCPPDAFSPEGQLWGTPVYDWDAMEQDGFSWWIGRLRQNLKYYDVIRLDHTRGFQAYYEVPASDDTALNGCWQPGPGMKLFDAVKKELGDVSLIAEDLGYITPEVKALIRDAGLPGMKVLQFAFDSDWENPHLPQNHTENCVVYTGTHDNDTTLGWYDSLEGWKKRFLTYYARREYGSRLMPAFGTASPADSSDDVTGPDGPEMSREKALAAMIELAMASPADTCIIPVQDILGLGSEARINVPGTVTGKNWSWQMGAGAFDQKTVSALKDLTAKYGRI